MHVTSPKWPTPYEWKRGLALESLCDWPEVPKKFRPLSHGALQSPTRTSDGLVCRGMQFSGATTTGGTITIEGVGFEPVVVTCEANESANELADKVLQAMKGER